VHEKLAAAGWVWLEEEVDTAGTVKALPTPAEPMGVLPVSLIANAVVKNFE
jgi:hypothetical protein